LTETHINCQSSIVIYPDTSHSPGLLSQPFVFDLPPLKFKLRSINFLVLRGGIVIEAELVLGCEALDKARTVRDLNYIRRRNE
jgi:hypothetical protein